MDAYGQADRINGRVQLGCQSAARVADGGSLSPLLSRGRVAGDRLRTERRRIDVHAAFGLQNVHVHEAYDQRDRRDDLELKQGFGAYHSHLAKIAHPGDADHHRSEDDGRQRNANEHDEAIAEV